MASAAPDIICGNNVECGFPADPYRLYLTQFINSFVNGTISDLQAKGRILSEIPKEQILALKKKVFGVCTKHDFPSKLTTFNAFMKTLASIVDISEDGVASSICELDTPLQQFFIGERVVDNRVVNLYIAGFTLHMFLQNPLFTIHIREIHMSDLNTFRRLLPNDEDLRTAYFEQRSDKTGFRSGTPYKDEVIVLATDFFSNERSRSAHDALTTTSIIMDDRVEREEMGGGLKKRNKSKRRKQKKSNKKSRHHHNRKRLSRRNAKRFY